MIEPISLESEKIWATLCTELWPEETIYSLVQQRLDGHMQNEFLYRLDDTDKTYVGFISLSIRRDFVEGTETTPVGYLEGIYVRPEHRGRGIARELLNFAKKWVLEQGCHEFASDCVITNQVSRDFHTHLGFQEKNTIVHFTMKL